MAIIRKVVKISLVPVAAVVSVPLVMPLIYADDTKSTGKLVKPKDLPIYDPPKEKERDKTSATNEQDFSLLEQGVSFIRKAFVTRMDTFEDTKERAFDVVKTGKRHAEDAINYVREENNVVPRGVLITLSGMGGLLAGARGGFFKKIIYSSTGIVAMASICYPQQAVQISQDAYKIGKYYSIITYNKMFENTTIKPSSTTFSSPSSPTLDQLAEQVKK